MTSNSADNCNCIYARPSVVRRSLLAAVAVVTILGLQSSALAQPVNDDCLGALNAFDGANPYDNTDATLDASTPVPSDGNMQDDIWFKYTSTCTGLLTIETCEGTAGADTVLEVYAGATCPPTVSLGVSDDVTGCGASGFSSRVQIPINMNDRVLIRLSGWNGGTVTGIMDIICTAAGGPEACCFPDGSCLDQTPTDCSNNGGTSQGVGTLCASTSCPQPPPANDECDMGVIEVFNGTTPIDLTGATSSGILAPSCGFPSTPSDNISNDLWFSYTATCTGDLFVDTCGDADDTRLAIYDADCAGIIGGAAPLECNDDHGNATEADDGNTCPNALSASLRIFATSGQTYIIRVGSFTGSPTTLMFPLNIACVVNTPPCDTCPGDVNGDELVNGLDIQNFVNCFLSDFGMIPSAVCACADVNEDAVIDALDIDALVNELLNGPGICNPGACCYAVVGPVTLCEITTELDCVVNRNGIFTLGGDCTGDPCPVGRCCSNAGITCDDISEVACNFIGGEWDGALNCNDNPCPTVADNDDCANAEPLVVPALVSGSTIGQGGETLGTCGTTDGTGGGVWYSVIGDGTTLTASTCNPGTDFDTKLRVYTDGCITLTCVGGNDDTAGAPPECSLGGLNRFSTVSWCSEPGREYLILVHGFSAAEGNFELSVDSDGISCIQACCLPDLSCQELSVAACTTAGGIAQGPGSDCMTTVCSDPNACNCNGVINTFPFVENFELDEPVCVAAGAFVSGCNQTCTLVGLWENRANGVIDDTDWLSHEGATGSGGTGASVDATTGTATGNYVYLESSSCTTGEAQLISPCLDFSGLSAPTFRFAYHLFGAAQGTVTVDVTTNACGSFAVEYTDGGNLGDVWNIGIVDLSAYAGMSDVRIRITGVAGGDFTSDMGLDDLEVFDGTATGACCDAIGCQVLTQIDCGVAGGLYQGDGTDCVSVDCVGACCTDIGCSDLTEVGCDAVGGLYQGNGTECASTNCLGACCDTGACTELTELGCDAAGGDFLGLGTTCTPNLCPQPPANDNCAGAIEVFTGTNAGGNNCLASTVDDREVGCQSNSNQDVWYFWVADCTGQATIDTETSVFAPTNDTVLSVHEVSCGGAEIACDDDDGTGLLSTLDVNVTMGETYYIRVAGFNVSCGDITLNISCLPAGGPEACCFGDGSCQDLTPTDCSNAGGISQGFGSDCAGTSCPQPPPANDDCSGATPVGEGSHPYDVAGSTLDATAPVPTDVNMDNDIWFVYTAGCTGTATIGTCEGGVGADTVLEVYDGGVCPPSLPSLAVADDTPGCGASGFSSEVTIPVVSGQQYLIRLSGWNSGEPAGLLDIACAP